MCVLTSCWLEIARETYFTWPFVSSTRYHRSKSCNRIADSAEIAWKWRFLTLLTEIYSLLFRFSHIFADFCRNRSIPDRFRFLQLFTDFHREIFTERFSNFYRKIFTERFSQIFTERFSQEDFYRKIFRFMKTCDPFF